MHAPRTALIARKWMWCIVLSLMRTLLLIVATGFIAVYPTETLHASKEGLLLWWERIVPAMLPMLILCDALMHVGIFRYLGTKLAPLLHTVYALPAQTGWALVTGFAFGSPMGSKITATLRRQGNITREEGNRLLAMSDLCSPLWIVSVIGTASWNAPMIGVGIIALHITSAWCAGTVCNTIMRLRSKPQPRPITPPDVSAVSPPIGTLLTTSIHEACGALLLIGGWMIVGSVVLTMIETFAHDTVRNLSWLYGIIDLNLSAFSLPPWTLPQAPNVTWAMCMGAMLAWGGLSLHAQVHAMLRGTDLLYSAFVLGRLVHVAISVPLTALCWPLFTASLPNTPMLFASANALDTMWTPHHNPLAIVAYAVCSIIAAYVLSRCASTLCSLAVLVPQRIRDKRRHKIVDRTMKLRDFFDDTRT
jgi:hypothetical protein